MNGKQKMLMWGFGIIVLILIANFAYKKYLESQEKEGPTKKKKTSFDLGGASSSCTSLTEVEFNAKRDKIYTDVWWRNGYDQNAVDAINSEFFRGGDPNFEAGWRRFAYDKMLLDGYCTHNAG